MRLPMLRPMLRYVVRVERYSLARGHVGETMDSSVMSSHRSRLAAGRKLATLINGRNPGGECGYRFYVYDSDAGLRYSRNGCVSGVPLIGVG